MVPNARAPLLTRKPIGGGYMSRFPIASALFAALTLAFIIFYIWLQTSTRRSDTPD